MHISKTNICKTVTEQTLGLLLSSDMKSHVAFLLIYFNFLSWFNSEGRQGRWNGVSPNILAFLCTGCCCEHQIGKRYEQTPMYFKHLLSNWRCRRYDKIRKNHLRLVGLKYAMFSLHEKWNNYPHPCRTVIA